MEPLEHPFVFAADDDKTITVAASETPHSEILEAAKPILEEEGYDLEVTVFDDYVQPNEVVDSGDLMQTTSSMRLTWNSSIKKKEQN